MQTEWIAMLKGDPLPWLLEFDPENPGVRYFALRELLDCPMDDPAVIEAHTALLATGPVPTILSARDPEGFWVEPGPGYYPKYRGTVWQIIMLAWLGADRSDPRVQTAGEYILEHTRSDYGAFSYDGRRSGSIHCLQGNLGAALIDLGWWGDPRLEAALNHLARSITGEGIASTDEKDAQVRYYRSGNSGPGFCCSANDHLPCAWGAVKALLALSKIPAAERQPVVQRAIATGLDFLLSHDPAVADYPMGYNLKPSRSWFQLGFPLGYVTDFLQNLEVLVALGAGEDPRLKPAVDLLLSKQDSQGRWKMEYSYNGKIWADIEWKGRPSKWVTLRAMRVFKKLL